MPHDEASRCLRRRFITASRQTVRLLGIKPHIDDIRVALPAAILTVAVFVFVYWLFVRFVERRPRCDEFAMNGWLRELGAGMTIGAVSFSIVIGIIAAFGGYRVTGVNPATVVLPVIVISLKSGVIEEIITRGIFFRIMERWLGSWAAILLSSALFGAGHWANPNATWWSTIAVGVEGGLVSAALYMLTRRLWGVIGEHFAWNFTQGGIFGAPISGYAISGVLLPHIAGTNALTGGAFGVEASVPGLIVEVMLGVGLLVIALRRGRFVRLSRDHQDGDQPIAAS
ncbi:CPBP family intramembrane metalloprotease [Sphingomonas sp. H160509]|uniref:CPBP family intramembrane glutamic endopeptidase n=1 Tax=Sphingomonas sp. H160509 TaxID=2955313 RepID=UPI00209733A0|nr:CPBP family intramembrane glutamic endopeptidase [Sphingomonas sp. H160509]MDD1453263.1 CPBP family intramembrane metalloprotease [Sphingomonas sp. H160509]